MRQLLMAWRARLGIVLAALVLASSMALAQAEVKKSPFGAGPAPIAQPAGSGQTVTGASGFWGWVLSTQAHYQRQMASAVREMKTSNPAGAALTLAFISFMYGVLHAAGPGHGKAIISSYVLANRQTLRRGIFLSFLSAFFQALSAILLVAILAIALKATSLTMKSAETWIEIVSWAAVALVGVWLLYRQLKRVPGTSHGGDHHHQNRHGEATPVPELVTAGHVHGPGCGHDHHNHNHHDHHDAASARKVGRVAFEPASPPHVHTAACAHGHDHGHVHDASCGHVHMPGPEQLQGPWDWGKAVSLAMTVGIRPCTGAILVMLFALSQGILWAGVFATFVMSFGTALTVSILAALAVGSRDLAIRLSGKESAWASRIESAVGIGGAVLVIALGAIGFVTSLTTSAPF